MTASQVSWTTSSADSRVETYARAARTSPQPRNDRILGRQGRRAVTGFPGNAHIRLPVAVADGHPSGRPAPTGDSPARQPAIPGDKQARPPLREAGLTGFSVLRGWVGPSPAARV